MCGEYKLLLVVEGEGGEGKGIGERGVTAGHREDTAKRDSDWDTNIANGTK